jgi:polyhydroxybutyrate depolymerase
MKRQQWITGLFVLILCLLACRAGKQNATSSTVTHTLIHDGVQRSYILYIPSSVDPSLPTPLVIAMHGGTGNAGSIIFSSEFNQVADDHGFIVVYPNGAGHLEDKLLTWNGGTCCGYAQRNNVDDVGFIRAMIVDIESRLSIDPKRIYATGMSNGGIMSYRLACEASDLFAAIAPVAGTLNFSPCSPTEPVAVIDFHGTADQNLPYAGGFGSESLVNVDFASVKDSVDFWISFNECSSQPETSSSDEVQHDVWEGCRNDSTVELYTIIDGGHAWPGGGMGWPGSDEPTQAISASEVIWEFFSEHSKP